jgi:hypothetical protein
MVLTKGRHNLGPIAKPFDIDTELRGAFQCAALIKTTLVKTDRFPAPGTEELVVRSVHLQLDAQLLDCFVQEVQGEGLVCHHLGTVLDLVVPRINDRLARVGEIAWKVLELPRAADMRVREVQMVGGGPQRGGNVTRNALHGEIQVDVNVGASDGGICKPGEPVAGADKGEADVEGRRGQRAMVAGVVRKVFHQPAEDLVRGSAIPMRRNIVGHIFLEALGCLLVHAALQETCHDQIVVRALEPIW